MAVDTRRGHNGSDSLYAGGRLVRGSRNLRNLEHPRPTVPRRFEGKLALNCFVIEAGEISVGDEVVLVRGRAGAESTSAAVFAD